MDSSDVYIAEFSKLYCFLGLFFLSVYESCTSLVKFILSTLFFFKKNYFFFIFGCIGSFVAVRGLSLVAESRGWFLVVVRGFPLQWFSCCGAQALGTQASVVVAHRL